MLAAGGLLTIVVLAGAPLAATQDRQPSSVRHGLAIDSVYPVPNSRGLIVTSGGWLYCANVMRLAAASGYTLLCGRYARDGYTAGNLRRLRHEDWGNPAYLSSFAAEIAAAHRRYSGPLIFIGVSYSGFAVATLASHHPELRPARLIVVDSYLDLVARRRHAGNQPTGREIDLETGGSLVALNARSVSTSGLANLVRHGTKLSVIWSITHYEDYFFRGATCAKDANADTLAQLAHMLGQPVHAWVTQGAHGHDLWDHSWEILNGINPGRMVVFTPSGAVPAGSYCPWYMKP